MNQILINQKLYVTPELKRKKKVYKINFMLSIFIVIILISMYIYGEYDRNKTEEVSQQILSDMETEKEDKKKQIQTDVLVVALNHSQEDIDIELSNDNQESANNAKKSTSNENEASQKKKYKTKDGYEYYTIATINIPKIKVNYSILQGETQTEKEIESLLKILPCKLEGPEPNEKGNLCIVGHNYRNTKFFSKVPTLEIGDTINITDLTGRTIKYEIYTKYEVIPEDVSCLDQKTKGKKEITIITCTDDGTHRVIVKAKEVK